MSHNYSIHKIGDPKFKCELCPYASMIRDHFNSHIKGVHEKARDHVCGECGYAFSEKGVLKRHKEAMHGKRDNKFKCDLCPYETHAKRYLRQHVTNVHSIHSIKLCKTVSMVS